jgi:hypothetical protein
MDDNIKESDIMVAINSLSRPQIDMFNMSPIEKLENTVGQLEQFGEDLKKFAKYKQSMKKAQIKYRENNRELINKISRDYYNRNKTNPEWLKKQSEKSQRSYQKKKANRMAKSIKHYIINHRFVYFFFFFQLV